MYNTNQKSHLLYDQISKKYSSMTKFAEIAGILQNELNAILLQDSVSHHTAVMLKTCHALNIDAEKFILNGEITEIESNVNTNGESPANKMLDYYMRLSDTEKELVIDFISAMLLGN